MNEEIYSDKYLRLEEKISNDTLKYRARFSHNFDENLFFFLRNKLFNAVDTLSPDEVSEKYSRAKKITYRIYHEFLAVLLKDSDLSIQLTRKRSILKSTKAKRVKTLEITFNIKSVASNFVYFIGNVARLEKIEDYEILFEGTNYEKIPRLTPLRKFFENNVPKLKTYNQNIIYFKQKDYLSCKLNPKQMVSDIWNRYKNDYISKKSRQVKMQFLSNPVKDSRGLKKNMRANCISILFFGSSMLIPLSLIFLQQPGNTENELSILLISIVALVFSCYKFDDYTY